MIAIRSRSGRPKNLIFASPTKPDIRITDAIDNDIEIVSNPDDVLVYDRPIGAVGLRWRDVQAWWQESRQVVTEDEAKAQLYRRLRQSLPATSPQQLMLFDLYHDIYRAAVHDLPALLPEVWLHWDPKTVRTRGVQALLNHRMDFLLLLPHSQRIVLEVDGMQHYAIDTRADPATYAATMRGNRDLTLAGYEVYRFGADELRDRATTRETIRTFFDDLFRRHSLTITSR